MPTAATTISSCDAKAVGPQPTRPVNGSPSSWKCVTSWKCNSTSGSGLRFDCRVGLPTRGGVAQHGVAARTAAGSARAQTGAQQVVVEEIVVTAQRQRQQAIRLPTARRGAEGGASCRTATDETRLSEAYLDPPSSQRLLDRDPTVRHGCGQANRLTPRGTRSQRPRIRRCDLQRSYGRRLRRL